MSDRKLQLNKKPVRALDSARLASVTGGCGGEDNPDDKAHPEHEMKVHASGVTKYRCVGNSGSSGG